MRDGTGRDGSFEAWYHAHAPRLTMTLTAASGDAALAEDAVSEAAARALARWRRVGAMPDLSAWVYRVALNELRRRLRRAARAESPCPHRDTRLFPVWFGVTRTQRGDSARGWARFDSAPAALRSTGGVVRNERGAQRAGGRNAPAAPAAHPAPRRLER